MLDPHVVRQVAEHHEVVAFLGWFARGARRLASPGRILLSCGSTHVGLRDRALIAVKTFAFARIGAVVARRVEDLFSQGQALVGAPA
jgi:hypothetical protein